MLTGRAGQVCAAAGMAAAISATAAAIIGMVRMVTSV